MSYEAGCPSPEALRRLAQETPGSIEFAGFEAHLEACPDCRRTLESMARLTPGSPAPSPSPAFAADEPPAVPGFEVGEVLGRGGMGVVYRARQRSLKRWVALKALHPSADPDGPDRAVREAELAARVSHPNVVTVHEVIGGPRPVLVLEYVEGGSLGDRLSDGPLPPRDAARLIGTVARAVAHLHRHGVIHRDLKPSNILIAGPRGAPPEGWIPKVADFGVARPPDDPASTPPTAPMGTPSYMAPEQADGREIGPPADVYALGAVLYRAITGVRPSRAATPIGPVRPPAGRSPVPPRRLAPRISRDLETIVLTCLEAAPSRRYASAEALADDLDRYLGGRPVLARRSGPAGRAWRACRRRPAVAGLAAAMACVVATGGAALLSLRGEAAGLGLEAGRHRANAQAARVEAEAQLREAAGLLVEVVGVGHGALVAKTGPAIEVLTRARDSLRRLLAGRPDDRRLRASLAIVAGRLAALELSRQDAEAAGEHAREALAIWSRWIGAGPEQRLALDGASNARAVLGVASGLLGRHEEAIPHLLRSLALIEPRAGAGEDQALLMRAGVRRLLTDALEGVGRSDEAWREIDRSRRELEHVLANRPDNAALIVELLHAGRCLADERLGIPTLERLAARAPDDLRLRHILGEAHFARARQVPDGPARVASHRKALGHLAEPVEELARRVEADPSQVALAADVALALRDRAACRLELGDLLQAAVDFDRSAKTGLAVLERGTPDRDRLSLVFDAALHAAQCRARPGDPPEVVTREIAGLERLAVDVERRCGRPPEVRSKLAFYLACMSITYRKTANPTGAAAVLERSRAVVEALGREWPSHPAVLDAYSEYWTQLGKTLCRGTDAEATLEAFRQSVELARRALGLAPADAALRDRLDHGLRRLANFALEARRFEEAEAALLEAADLWPHDRDRRRTIGAASRRLAAGLPAWAEESRDRLTALAERLAAEGDSS